MIHNHNQTPFLEHEGFDIRPGIATTIGIQQVGCWLESCLFLLMAESYEELSSVFCQQSIYMFLSFLSFTWCSIQTSLDDNGQGHQLKLLITQAFLLYPQDKVNRLGGNYGKCTTDGSDVKVKLLYNSYTLQVLSLWQAKVPMYPAKNSYHILKRAFTKDLSAGELMVYPFFCVLFFPGLSAFLLSTHNGSKMWLWVLLLPTASWG